MRCAPTTCNTTKSRTRWSRSGACSLRPEHRTPYARTSAELNVKTGQGTFRKCSAGNCNVEHTKPNPVGSGHAQPAVLYRKHVDRVDMSTYRIFHARLTVCDPEKPTWTFERSEATLHVDKTAALLNANFRLFSDSAFLPALRRACRRAGGSGNRVSSCPRSAEVPCAAKDLGDSYYWAPTNWADATVGAEWLALRGSRRTGEIRMKPSENIDFSAEYSGVADKLGEGGHRIQRQS